MRVSDISIIKRLGSIFVFGIGVFLAVLGGMIVLSGEVLHQADILSRPKQDAALLKAEVAHLVWANSLQDYLMNYGKEPLRASLDGRACEFGKWFYGDGRLLLEGEVPTVVPIMREMETYHLRLHESGREIRDLASAGKLEEAETVFRQTSLPQLEQVRKHLSEARDETASATSNVVATLRDIITTGQMTAYIVVAIVILGGGLAVFLFCRSISVPLHALVNYAHRISQGNFVEAPVRQKDEIGQLAAAFEAMVQDLKEKMGVSQGVIQGIVVPFMVCDKQKNILHVNQAMLDCWGVNGSPQNQFGKSSAQFSIIIPPAARCSTRCWKQARESLGMNPRTRTGPESKSTSA